MPEPSRVRRQLGGELRTLRTLAGLTQRDMEARVGLRQVPVSRIERGEQLLSAEDARRWAHATGASENALARVMALVEAVHGETRPWSELGAGAGGLQAVAAGREESAVRVRDCALSWLPGLCQTAEYARLLIPQVDVDDSIDHATAVAARVERQQVLYRPGCTFEFLIGQEALSWAPGAGVMAGQRDKLASIATLSGVQVGVLPPSRVGAPAWHNFTLYDPAGDDGVYVTTELLHGGQESHDLKVVGLYEALWVRLWSAAVHGDEAAELLRGPS